MQWKGVTQEGEMMKMLEQLERTNGMIGDLQEHVRKLEGCHGIHSLCAPLSIRQYWAFIIAITARTIAVTAVTATDQRALVVDLSTSPAQKFKHELAKQ